MPVPLPEINDYSPDENSQNYMSQSAAYPTVDNPYAIPQLSAHQTNGVCNQFTSVPNPLIGFSDECRDRVNVLIEAERYLLTYFEDENVVSIIENQNRQVAFPEIFQDPRLLCPRTRISPTVGFLWLSQVH